MGMPSFWNLGPTLLLCSERLKLVWGFSYSFGCPALARLLSLRCCVTSGPTQGAGLQPLKVQGPERQTGCPSQTQGTLQHPPGISEVEIPHTRLCSLTSGVFHTSSYGCRCVPQIYESKVLPLVPVNVTLLGMGCWQMVKMRSLGWALNRHDSVLIKRRYLDPETHVRTKSARCMAVRAETGARHTAASKPAESGEAWDTFSLSVPGGTNPASTLISDSGLQTVREYISQFEIVCYCSPSNQNIDVTLSEIPGQGS